MTDIISTERAKAEEQATKLIGGPLLEPELITTHQMCDAIVTALLEAKADALETYAPDAESPWRSDFGRPGPYHVLLRREVTNRRLRGL